MTDIIDGLGSLIRERIGLPYAGQEPQDKSVIPTGGIVILERIGGRMSGLARSDDPWVQVTVLASSKKRAYDLLRDVRALVGEPRTRVGDLFVYGVEEVLAPEDASLPADPFYRVRSTFRFKVKGLA